MVTAALILAIVVAITMIPGIIICTFDMWKTSYLRECLKKHRERKAKGKSPADHKADY